MKCECCNAEVAAGWTFCLNCGARVGTENKHQEAVPSAENVPAVQEERVEIPEVPAGSELRFSWKFDEDDQPVVRLETVRQEQKETDGTTQQEEMIRDLRQTIPNLWLPDQRSWVKMLLLGIVTLGIYPAVIWSRMVTELNIAASRYDGKRTMPWFAMAALSVVTLSVFSFVWHHRFCRRVGAELKRRNIDCQLRTRDFWLWNVLGSLILAGPVIYVHKVTKAMNLINMDYNSCG